MFRMEREQTTRRRPDSEQRQDQTAKTKGRQTGPVIDGDYKDITDADER